MINELGRVSALPCTLEETLPVRILAVDIIGGGSRVMILPREFLGRSSITYVNAEDRDKPKNQSYQIFLDQPIELPR